MTTVPDRLAALSKIFEERAAMYGDNYLHIGTIMMGMFPYGLEVRTAEEFNRLHLFFHLVGKMTRYARQMPEGGHDDSLDDTALYSMILRQFDFIASSKKAG